MKRILKVFSVLVVLMLAVIGASCDVLNDKGSTNPADLVGNWQLYKQTGAQQDVCPNEMLNILASGSVTLQCPGQQVITRTYTAQNGVLTYTETGVSFDYYVTTQSGQTVLEMYGKNVSRNLFYNKVTAAEMNLNKSESAGGETPVYNSSEK